MQFLHKLDHPRYGQIPTSKADMTPTRHRHLQSMFMPCTESCNFAGIQYEQKLNKMLADAGIAFWTEEHLRDKGFFKTPDAKLQVTCVHSKIICYSMYYGSMYRTVMCEMLSLCTAVVAQCTAVVVWLAPSYSKEAG